MAVIQLYYSIIKETSKDSNQSSFPLLIPILLLIEVLLSNAILYHWVCIQKFLSRYWSVLHSQLHCTNPKPLVFELPTREEDRVDEKKDDGSLCRQELEMLMQDLGIFCSPESEELPKVVGSDELLGLFDEKEPSLEELKEAFDVFDQNRDGFIDANELQRVLCVLRSKEGSELENCKRMIRTFDENRDGRIDFNEFVKVMENNFC